MLNLTNLLIIGFSVVTISFLGIILNRSNIIITFLCIEMLFLSVNFIFAVYAVFLDDILGQIYALFFLTVAAAESAIGIGLLVDFFRVRKDILIYSSILRG